MASNIGKGHRYLLFWELVDQLSEFIAICAHASMLRVGPRGIEPRTRGLKVRCSAD